MTVRVGVRGSFLCQLYNIILQPVRFLLAPCLTFSEDVVLITYAGWPCLWTVQEIWKFSLTYSVWNYFVMTSTPCTPRVMQNKSNSWLQFIRWVCLGEIRQEGSILFLFFTIKQLHLWQDVKSDSSRYNWHKILKPDHHMQNLQRKWLRICFLAFELWNHKKIKRDWQDMEKICEESSLLWFFLIVGEYGKLTTSFSSLMKEMPMESPKEVWNVFPEARRQYGE
jgi:hypothetical protein